MVVYSIEDHRLYYKGTRFFYSQLELNGRFPCKVYKIDETFATVQEPHYHDYFQIWYVSKGEFIHEINDQSYRMVMGNLYIVPPYTIHRFERAPGRSVEIIGCEFTPAFIDEKGRDLSFRSDSFDAAYIQPFLVPPDQLKPKIALSGRTNDEVHRLMLEMLKEYQKEEPYYELVVKSNLLKLLSILIRAYRQEHDYAAANNRFYKYRPMIAKVIEHIHKHYDQELRIDQMCRMTNLSKTYFCDLFKHFTGKTFNDYLIDYRIKRSTELLIQTNLTITDICYQVGFNDLTYFSRAFKKHTGISPSHYKKYAWGLKP